MQPTDIWTFMDTSPWLTVFLAPVVLIALFACIGVCFKVWNRLLRTVKVCVRGWPPEHLDADGDFKPPQNNS